MARTEVTDLDNLILQVGEVQASPTSNTVLDRLKQIQGNTAGAVNNFTVLNSSNVNASKIDLDTISTNSGTTNSSNTDIDVNTTSIALKMGEVQSIPTANTQLGRLKNINDSLVTLTRSITPIAYGTLTLNTNPKNVLPANVNRRSSIIQALSGNTSICYVGYDNNVTNTNYAFSLNPGDIYTQDSYLGDIFIANVTATDNISFGEV